MISLPEKVHEKMFKYEDENWSLIAFRAFQARLTELEGGATEIQNLESEIAKLKKRVLKLEKHAFNETR